MVLHACDHENCTYTTDHTGHLAAHKRSHTDEKPFLCEVCGKSFPRADNLSRHIKTHTDIRSFVCDREGCKKSFTQSGHLTRNL